MIPIWRCSYCGDPHCILLRFDDESPDVCPFSGNIGVFVPDEIEEDALIKYLDTYAEKHNDVVGV